MGAAPILSTTVEEYFAYDDSADCQNEFHDGAIYPQNSASTNHGVLQTNVAFALGNLLKDSPCKPYVGLRYQANEASYVYPDVGVVCGPFVYAANGQAVINPTVIVEILSPSTADYDYGGKFELYREMDTVVEYVLVSQSRCRVEVFGKTPSGRWLLSRYQGLDVSVPLQSLGVQIPMAEIYSGDKLQGLP